MGRDLQADWVGSAPQPPRGRYLAKPEEWPGIDTPPQKMCQHRRHQLAISLNLHRFEKPRGHLAERQIFGVDGQHDMSEGPAHGIARAADHADEVLVETLVSAEEKLCSRSSNASSTSSRVQPWALAAFGMRPVRTSESW